HQGDQVVGSLLLGRDLLEGAVVEHVAVLVDLHEGRPPVLVGPAEDLHHVLAVHVVGSGHEAGFRPQGQAHGVEGEVDRSERGRLGHLPLLAGGRVLTLGQPVDLVVEQQDGEVDVAAQGVDEVVAAYGERVAVARHHPDVQVGPGQGQPGGDGGGPPVDGVHPVDVHVVGEAGRAADAGDEDHVLPAHAQLGHEHLHCGEDRVVPAPRAPAHLVVAGPVLLGRGGYGGVGNAGTPWGGPAGRWAVMAGGSSGPV